MAKRTYTDAELACLELARRAANKHRRRNANGAKVVHLDPITEALREKGTAELVADAEAFLLAHSA